MDCTLIEGDLVPFHFGTLADAPRATVEAHLVGCARCLQAFLEVKRAIEKGHASSPRPSSALRARLRADLRAEFAQPRRSVRVWGAVAAMVVAVGLVGLLTHRPQPPGPAASAPAVGAPIPGTPVDSARPVTAQVHFL